MSGTFTGAGVGPGDPELMTLKAVRAIRECSVIAVPVSDGELSEPFFEKAEGKGGHTQYLERCVAYRIARGSRAGSGEERQNLSAHADDKGERTSEGDP